MLKGFNKVKYYTIFFKMAMIACNFKCSQAKSFACACACVEAGGVCYNLMYKLRPQPLNNSTSNFLFHLISF